MPDATQLFTGALNQAVKSAGAAAPVAADIDSPGAAERWIGANIPDQAMRDKVKQAFDTNVQADIAQRAGAAGQILSTFSLAGLPKFGWEGWHEPGSMPWRIVGVLIGALLLSLGAPFWFNTLSSLSSL